MQPSSQPSSHPHIVSVAQCRRGLDSTEGVAVHTGLLLSDDLLWAEDTAANETECPCLDIRCRSTSNVSAEANLILFEFHPYPPRKHPRGYPCWQMLDSCTVLYSKQPAQMQDFTTLAKTPDWNGEDDPKSCPLTSFSESS